MIDLSQYVLGSYREGGVYVACKRMSCINAREEVWTIADAVEWAEAHEAAEHPVSS